MNGKARSTSSGENREVGATPLINSKNHGPASSPLDAEIDHLLDGLRERIKQRMRELVDDAVITERRRLNAEFEGTLAQAYGDGQDKPGFIA